SGEKDAMVFRLKAAEQIAGLPWEAEHAAPQALPGWNAALYPTLLQLYALLRNRYQRPQYRTLVDEGRRNEERWHTVCSILQKPDEQNVASGWRGEQAMQQFQTVFAPSGLLTQIINDPL